jgi:hypothetical protein
MAAARAGVPSRSTSVSYLTRNDLRFFDSAARKYQSNNVGHGSLEEQERIDKRHRGRKLLVVCHGAGTQFIKRQIDHCSLQSLKLLFAVGAGDFSELARGRFASRRFRPNQATVLQS